MSRNRPYTDYPRNEAGLVDTFIGTAYDTVKKVYDNLDEIKRLDGVLGEIPDLAQGAIDEALDIAMPPIREEMAGEVEKARVWAEGTEPVPGSKSSREWAENSEEVVAAGVMTINQISAEAETAAAIAQTQIDESVAQAESARDAAQLAANIYPTIAEGLAATTDGQYFTVPGVAGGETFLTLYENSLGTEVEIGRYPSMVAVTAAVAVLELIKQNNISTEYLSIIDPEGAFVARLTATLFETLSHYFGLENGKVTIKDDEGGVSFQHTATDTIVGPMTLRYTDMPGVFITNDENEVLTPEATSVELVPDPFEAGLLWEPVVATSALYPSYLYPQSILTDRTLLDDVVTSLGSNYDSTKAYTGNCIPLQATDMGEKSWLTLRQKSQPDNRRFLNQRLINVPTQVGATVNILIIGDSIANRQGALFLSKYLSQMGCTANFIGTLNGSAAAADANNANGPLGEAREGWETGDFTFAVNNRGGALAPGQEAAYNAMSKTQRWPINVFVRPTVVGDDPTLVKNGHVFDMVFYQERFGLATPDIVLNMLGTNDVRDQLESDIYSAVYDNDMIMHKQIRAAWPDVKIIRSVPGSSICVERNELWKSEYSQIIKAFKQVKADLADSKIIIAPLWAMVDHEVGYSWSNTAPGTDGFAAGTFSDKIHPIGATREGLYKALAPFVLAAKLNLI